MFFNHLLSVGVADLWALYTTLLNVQLGYSE